MDFGTTPELQKIPEPGWPNRIFWPALTAISLILTAANYSRFAKLTFPTHIRCLFAYLAFAGTSVLWAFKPEFSFIRFIQQVMVLTSIILPAMLAARKADLIRGMFMCFALAAILNIFFVLDTPASNFKLFDGYVGYFKGKNYLGEFAAIAFLLALHETLYPGFRRASGIVITAIAVVLLFLANSKTAIGLSVVTPSLAALTLFTRKITRISLAILLLSIPLGYQVLSITSGANMNRVSYMLYGDPTFTGRTTIWEFADNEIARRPLLGWGYQSFWLVGPDAPSVVEAPGWVKKMPNAHNGYVDTKLEMGQVGLAFLLAFIIATLHAIGRVADRDPTRAWIVLSLALYIIIYNFLESLWMRGYEFMWVVFVILAVETARYCQRFPARRVTNASTSAKSAGTGASDARRPRGRVPI
jgi:O-antigen ligase